VIVSQINVKYVPLIEPENDPPIAGNRNRLKTFQATHELVQAIARPSHMFNRICGIKVCHNDLNFIDMVGIYLAPVPAFIQPPQSAMLEAAYH
jgi:hypothetical protein